jgi:hypothetical protein
MRTQEAAMATLNGFGKYRLIMEILTFVVSGAAFVGFVVSITTWDRPSWYLLALAVALLLLGVIRLLVRHQHRASRDLPRQEGGTGSESNR